MSISAGPSAWPPSILSGQAEIQQRTLPSPRFAPGTSGTHDGQRQGHADLHCVAVGDRLHLTVSRSAIPAPPPAFVLAAAFIAYPAFTPATLPEYYNTNPLPTHQTFDPTFFVNDDACGTLRP